jgi:hypothetical protein
VKYIATTMGYNMDGKSRMIIGHYDIEQGRIDDGYIIYSPEETWCEKNWIPIIHHGKEMFIYKWNPIQIGSIVEEEIESIDVINKDDDRNENGDAIGGEEEYIKKTNIRWRLQIDMQIENKIPMASKIRGSSIFQWTDEGWMGVVHYSEEHNPRQYFHMLVVLDGETLAPVKWTHPFCFEKLGIEFCIGFRVCNRQSVEDLRNDSEKYYIFWISRHDRDPIMIRIEDTKIVWV